MRLVITQGPDLIADIPDFTGPLPRVGEYIGHPDADNTFGGISAIPQISGCVKTVVHCIMARPSEAGRRGQERRGEQVHFIGHSSPYVQVSI